jgi:hypothetical protein
VTASEGTPINRPLFDSERQLLADLAVKEVAKQANCTNREASVVLAKMAVGGQLFFVGDAEKVRVTNHVGGWFVEATREWLSFYSSFPEDNEETDHDN